MTFARTLAQAMPEFTRLSPRGGTIRVDDDVVPVEVNRYGDMTARFTVAPTGSWVQLSHRDTQVFDRADATSFWIGDYYVQSNDLAVARAWLDYPAQDALAYNNDRTTFVLRGAHVEVVSNCLREPFFVKDPLRVGAILATRSARLAREIAAATSYLSPRITGAQWGIDGAFTLVVARLGGEATIDWVWAGQLYTRVRVAIDEARATLEELTGPFPSKLAAVRGSPLERGKGHLAVLRAGFALTAETLDPALDLVLAIAAAQRGPSTASPYR